MNLLAWRKKMGFDQAKAAVVLGVSQPTISRIEAGSLFPSPEKAAQIVRRSRGKITLAALSAAYLSARANVEGSPA